MTAKELIEELSKYPQDMEVVAFHPNHFSYQLMDVWENTRNRIILEIKIK